MPFRKVLVANRGEIALRVFRTCRRLGIETVAVAAPDDLASLHARSAGEVVEIASYLDPAEHVRAAMETRADAVHPGYGFLAESPELAAAVEHAGLAWVGPPSEVLRRAGDKLEAKRVAAAVGVATLDVATDADVLPLVVKAAAGGGGRGMRVVRHRNGLGEALAAASREAHAAFGDGAVFCERYLERPRHVEVQLLADADHAVPVGLRDCSVQRRHQKVLEESPPPALGAAVTERVSEDAARLAASIGYRGAGTAEFLVDGNEAFFLELNARIQVEHPVTEELTRLDLVEWQLRLAAGEPLELNQHTHPNGHAVEARLYAEDARTFLPQSGRLERFRLPDGIRIDAGVEEGDTVGTGYDPLLAKLVAHGVTRDEALDRLAAALAETEVAGVVTNLAFLRWLVAHPSFRAGRVSTAFLVDHPPLSPPPHRLPAPAWAAPWRLNLPGPPPAPPPDVDVASHHRRYARGGSVTSPMPGTVIAVHVAAGEEVEPRQPLVTLEAMKMEHPVTAPFPATVSAVHVSVGDTVAAGQHLVELSA